jgi:hypothetical protein
MMLGMRCILFIFFFVCFFLGAQAIEIYFSAEDGGESVGISDEYDVSKGSSVFEESEAKFGNMEMTNSREVAGLGDLYMEQKFNGRSVIGSYTAGRILKSESVQALCDSSNANLKPISFDARASTTANAAVGSASTEIYGNTDRCFFEFFAYIRNGFLQNIDSMNIDNGVTGTHSSIYKTTGYNGYLEDRGIAINEKQSSHRYSIQGWWDRPEPYILGVEATASARKSSLDLIAKISVEKDPE